MSKICPVFRHRASKLLPMAQSLFRFAARLDWRTADQCRTKHPSKMPPEVEEKIPSPQTPISSRTHPDRLVPGALSRDQSLRCGCLSHAQAPWPEPPASGDQIEKGAYTALQQAGARPSTSKWTSSSPIFKTLRRGATAIEGSAASLQTSAFGSCGQSKSQNDRPNAGLFRGRCRYRVREASPRHCRVTAGSGHSDYPTFLLINHMRDNSIKINAIRPSRCTSPG